MTSGPVHGDNLLDQIVTKANCIKHQSPLRNLWSLNLVETEGPCRDCGAEGIGFTCTDCGMVQIRPWCMNCFDKTT